MTRCGRSRAESPFFLPCPTCCDQAMQACRGLPAVELRSGHVEYERFPGFAIGRRLDAVQPQEDDRGSHGSALVAVVEGMIPAQVEQIGGGDLRDIGVDRKSTRLNSSHLVISYAVFCLKKKKNNSSILTEFRYYSNYK